MENNTGRKNGDGRVSLFFAEARAFGIAQRERYSLVRRRTSASETESERTGNDTLSDAGTERFAGLHVVFAFHCLFFHFL